MKTRAIVFVILAYWAAAGLSHMLTSVVAIGRAEPDALLILAIVLAMVSDPRRGAFYGFAAGMIDGAIVGADMSTLVVTRTLVGFLCGQVGRLDFEVRPAYAGVAVAGATLVCFILAAFPAPPPQVGPYVRDTIIAALYNGVLAVPLYAMVRRSFRRQVN